MRKFLNLDRNRKREKKRKPSWEREKEREGKYGTRKKRKSDKRS